MSIEEVIAEIKAATPNPITPEAVAETFVLGGTATDLQREIMKKALVGSVVEWDLVVYEVAYSEGTGTRSRRNRFRSVDRARAAGGGRRVDPVAGAGGRCAAAAA